VCLCYMPLPPPPSPPPCVLSLLSGERGAYGPCPGAAPIGAHPISAIRISSAASALCRFIYPIRYFYIDAIMTLGLTEDEARVLTRHLRHAWDYDPYPFAPSLGPLEAILAKLEPPEPRSEAKSPLRAGIAPCRGKSAAVGSVKSALWAALLLLTTGVVASGQTDSDVAYAAMIEALCRGYAAAQVGMPADSAFDQCMLARHCRAAPRPSGYQCEMPQPMSWHGGGY
jgi:hypothetical protein